MKDRVKSLIKDENLANKLIKTILENYEKIKNYKKDMEMARKIADKESPQWSYMAIVFVMRRAEFYNNMKALFVVGPSGSGKTTISATLSQTYKETLLRCPTIEPAPTPWIFYCRAWL